MNLISREEVLEYLDKRRTYELMDGRNKAYGKGIRDAIKDIEALPSVPAAPLDKLCEWLPNAVHSCPANTEGHNEKCEHMKCEECWKEAICNWMEEDNANQT